MKTHAWLVMLMGMIMCPFMVEAGSMACGEAKYTIGKKPYMSSPWTCEDGYAKRAGHKLAFGAKNTLFGIGELFNEPGEAYRDRQGTREVARAMGRGMAHLVADTIGGAVQLTTFPITGVDVELPEGGTDVL